ncbi:hypothetical protein K438DRAFT_1982279 [Mycena galopus ATCC 62051]|nr:hypothetical protein K438DRAFT_1982279 [Mycena galopus ATCC 62051]
MTEAPSQSTSLPRLAHLALELLLTFMTSFFLTSALAPALWLFAGLEGVSGLVNAHPRRIPNENLV